MAYRTYPSPSESQSPPSSSSNMTPETHTVPLDNIPAGDDNDYSGQSTQGTPSRSTTSLPRTQNAGKGGCWTCRVRRKKCDEQREGDSCKTCRRLTIKCLGWGVKRPDWMRDKKNVDAYKASIKAQLSRAGLIRGQPRHNPMQVSSQRSHPRHSTASESNTPAVVNLSHPDYSTFNQYGDQPYGQNDGNLIPAMPGASNSAFDHLSTASYTDVNMNGFDQASTIYPYSPASIASGSGYPTGLELDHTFPLFPISQDIATFPDTTSTFPNYHVPIGQTPLHEELVMHYFDHVCKVQFIFAGEKLTEITYNAVLDEPRGAVTYAICALADLHLTQMRVSQGLEAPNLNPAASTANYLRQEAMFKLKSNRENGREWMESDAIAALHLVSYSHLSGGGAEWEESFSVLCQWLLQSNLSVAGDNTKILFQSLSPASQLLAKLIMWLDIFSSLSSVRPPKFLSLWTSLLGDQSGYWADNTRLDMASLTGCPDDAMLAIAEISALAQWKATQQRNGSLSYPELIRRGTIIEQRIRRNHSDQNKVDAAQTLVSLPDLGEGMAPSDEHREIAVTIFRETALLYLHTILSNSSPGVAEISASVEELVRQFQRLPTSNLDRALVFPICLAGCMTNDSNKRDFLKGRFRGLNETYGNLLQTRLLMEAVWQRRDVGGEPVDLRETIRDQGLNLLLI